MIDFRSFTDELSKIAIQLNKDERRRQAAQYATLGAMTGPVVGSISNLIQHGRLGPASGVPLRRWIPATMATGALVSGAVPAIRNMLTKRIEDQARARQEAGQ